MRLIDADAALDNMNKGLNLVYDLTDLPDFLAGCPTIYAEPIIHSKWVCPDSGVGAPYCLMCRFEEPFFVGYGYYAPYHCPCCGAVMDLEEE